MKDFIEKSKQKLISLGILVGVLLFLLLQLLVFQQLG